MIKLLLKHNADVNKKDARGWTPLHCATTNGNPPAIMCLVEKGAGVNLTNNEGNSPLHFLVRHGTSEKMSKVLDLVNKV